MRQLGLGVALLTLVVGFMFFYRTPPPTASVNGVSLRLELAVTEAARELGLGGRVNVPENYGMLFVFAIPDRYGFWMKDTLVPLDMFWLDAQGHVIFYMNDVATSTYPTVFYPPAAASYVLETAAGFGRAHSVATGTPILLQNIPHVL